MLSEPMTRYKLMILYMLKQVNFPLTSAQLSNFFLDHEYTTYFTLNQALNELLEAKLLHVETAAMRSHGRERKPCRSSATRYPPPSLKTSMNI